jgi:hypothetical protein
VDVAKKYIKSAPLLDRLVNEKSGSESNRNEQIEVTVKRAEAWASRNPNLLDPLNGIVYESTLTRVDPTKPRSEYEGKTDSSGNQLDKVWDGMQKEVKQLGPEGMAIYSMMRDSYKKLYEQILKTIDTRIDEAMDDKARSAIVKKEIYARLTAKGGFNPYFPLTRSGSYWLSYNATNPRTGNKELYVEAFESKRARERAQEEYATHGAENFEEFVNVSQINYRSAPATSFVNGVLKVMEANKVDPTVIDETMRLFLTTLPETSFAQSFRTRKGTLGFKQDAVGALREKTLSISRQLANMEYAGKFANLRTQMLTEFKESGSKADAKPYLEEMNKRIDFAISPQIPTWSKVFTSAGFGMTLGFNLSSALVNLAQIPLVVAPYLGGKYGFGATTKALGEATRIFTTSGFQQDTEAFVPTETGEKKVTVRAMPSLDNIDFDAKGLDPRVKRLKTLAQVAGDLGQLNRSQMYETLDVGKSKSFMTKINAASGWAFHHGERMNRQVSLIMAYNLELDRLNSDKATAAEKALSSADKETAAAEQAIYMTELTNGGTAAAAAPRIAQNSIGRIVFMFKRYGASMYYLMYKTARVDLRSADPETRRIAMRQIAGVYGSSALMAGAQGLPMFGIAAMIYNAFKSDDEDDFDTATRKYFGETLYSGALNELTGVTIASRIGLSDLLIRDTQKKESQTILLSALEMMGGPVYGVGTRIERGIKLINEGETMRGVESILPSAFGNVMKAIRYANEGTSTLRGDPITGEVGVSNVFAQLFGFAPAEYTRQLEINSRLKEADKKATQDKSKYLKQFYIATRMGDTDEANEAMKKLQELGKKHPGLRITGETIRDSMRQHARQSATMYHGISLSRGMRAELLADAAEYDGDTYRDEE